MWWLGFMCGLFCGCGIGLLTAGLCCMARKPKPKRGTFKFHDYAHIAGVGMTKKGEGW